MHPEVRDGVTADRCETCHSLWFDTRELDAWLHAHYPAAAVLPEARHPHRGIGGRRCPRCAAAMETTGWTGSVLDRCPSCAGLFVEPREILELEQREPPYEPMSLEQQLQAGLVSASWNLLAAKTLAILLLRFLR